MRILLLLMLLLPALLLSPPPAPVPPADRAWNWPLDPPPRVLRPFDPPGRPWLPGHRGVDLAAEPGRDVLAAGPGRVHFAGTVAGTPVVSVSHGELRTTYLPVETDLARGDPVRGGQVIGTLAEGPRHCADRPCLHWGLLSGREYLDPLSLLGPVRTRLLPRPGPAGTASQ
ncbi:Peptidase family M23 [Nocardiopsis flavescens]|uniref:Peptidase family M23 n=1 Tax=Nocardiopsis flavescens TaxID=758803 RepID=A0A1M6KER8_9ACTN|nr:M23 family metallopeptidase [Nocardiopsis flavescens]SHJ57451.1 Peptidase family M23 [Nocardiopsis flavescens]